MKTDTSETTITKIFWKRTYLFVEYESKKPIDLSILLVETDEKNNITKVIKQHKLETKQLDKNTYRSKLNITIAEGREILTPGEWLFVIDGDINKKPKLSDDVLSNIEEFSRVFRYGQNFYAYVVSFNIRLVQEESYKEDVYLSFISSFMKQNKNPYKRSFSDAMNDSKSIKKNLLSIARFLLNLYYQIVTHLTVKNGKRVLFMSENRNAIMDNLEAIDRRMKERNLDKEFKISYSFRNVFERNKGQNLFQWLKVITKIAKQDYIFVDDYVPIFSFLNLNKKTTLVQVWHAGFGFKLVGYGRFGIAGSPYPMASCHRKYTYGLIGNDHLREIYSEVWGIDKKSLLATGMPRLEHFLDKDYMNKVTKEFYEKYPQLKGKEIITFAPTYRGENQLVAFYDYSKIDFDRLYKYCKERNAAVLFGKHHFIKDDIPIKDEYKDLIYDMSSYKINDLFYVTNILVTDYSSAFYDYLLLKRPVLFYVYDKLLFSATRGVHRPIDKVAPGKVCNNFDEFMDALYNRDYGNVKAADLLIDKCVTNKQLASDKVIDYILLHKEVKDICEK